VSLIGQGQLDGKFAWLVARASVKRTAQLRLPLKLHGFVGVAFDLSEDRTRQHKQLAAFNVNGRRVHQADAFARRGTQRSYAARESAVAVLDERATRHAAAEQSAEVAGFDASQENHGIPRSVSAAPVRGGVFTAVSNP